MAALLVLVLLCLGVHQVVIQPLADGLLPWLHGAWPLWILLAGLLWLFAGPRRSG